MKLTIFASRQTNLQPMLQNPIALSSLKDIIYKPFFQLLCSSIVAFALLFMPGIVYAQCPATTFTVGSGVGIPNLSGAPAGLANMTGGSVKIWGSFTVDAGAWQMRGVTVYLRSLDATINVNSGCTLLADSHPATNLPTEFDICADVTSWVGINALGNSTVILRNSKVNNACTAVALQGISKVMVVGNTFKGNSRCITLNGLAVLLGEGIAHNTFDINPVNQGCTGSTAIRLTNAGFVRIGNQAQTGIPNKIIGYYGGVDANNTNVDIVNTTFEQGSTGAAISLSGVGGTFTANITGKGNFANSPIFVNNYGAAITAKNYKLTVKNARFRTSNNTISISKGTPITFPISLDVTQNRFENYVTDAVVSKDCIFTKANIKNNFFFDENPAEGGYSAGVHWNNNSNATDLVKPNIELNYFYDNAKTSPDPQFIQYQTFGVWATSPQNLVVHDNVFTQNYQTDIQHEYKGVWITGKNRNESSNNTFSGLFGPMNVVNNSDWDYRGIDINNSRFNLVSCNGFSSLNYGSYFKGNCDQADIKNNVTSSNLTGTYLFDGSVVGKQPEKQNLWPGNLSNDIAEAHFDGNPLPGALSASLFSINSSNMASDYWPSPRIPTNNWFVPSGNEPGPQIQCIISAADPKSERERQAITSEFQAYKGYPASIWEARLDAFGTLSAHPELLVSGSADAQFYNLYTTGNIGKLHRALLSCDAVVQFSTSFANSWNSNQTAIEQKISDIGTQTDLMEQAQTDAEQLQIAQTIATLQSELGSLQSTNQSLSAQYQSDVAARANTLLNDLGNITTTDVWETNLKTVLTLSAQKLLAESVIWSSGQQSTLQGIADQCRHEGGIGVVMARIAIGAFNYNDEAMCPGQGQERSETTIHLPATLAPNPASDLCRISFEKLMSGTLFVRDLQGQIVLTFQLKEEIAFDLDTHNWVNGLYNISIKDVQGRQFVSKLAVIH